MHSIPDTPKNWASTSTICWFHCPIGASRRSNHEALVVRSHRCLVVDSVAALVPKAELDGEMGDRHMGLQARLMSQALRKLTGTVSNPARLSFLSIKFVKRSA